MTPEELLDWWHTWWPVILTALPFVLSTAAAIARRTQTPKDDEAVELARGVLGEVLGRASFVEPDKRSPSALKSPLAKTWTSDRREADVLRQHESGESE